MDELDNLLKNALEDEVNSSEQDTDKSFIKLKTNLVNINKKYHCSSFSYINFKKISLITMCCLVCVLTILISSSSNVRAAALDAIDSIKSIFVVESFSDNIKIVQKPASEALAIFSEGKNTSNSDAEVGNLVGYKVLFPKTINNSFILSNRALGVVLGKELSYDFYPKIQQQVIRAIENQEEFTKLTDYSPFRYFSATYKKGDTSIFIYTEPAESYSSVNNSETEEIKIGNIKGIWFKTLSTRYPWIEKGGEFDSDMSVKPIIKYSYVLKWENNNIVYTLSSADEDRTPSKEEYTKIATEFQAAQK